MPQVIPVIVGAFQTAVTWAATTAASATLALTGSAVASAFVGNSILAAGGMLSASVAAGAPLAAATGLLLRTVAIQQLMKALSPKPKNINGGAQIRFGPNPQAPRPFLFGRTGTAGTPVVATTHGAGKNNNKWLTYIVALSAFGPVQSIEALALNGVNAPVSGGMVVSGQYANKVWSTYRNGEWTQVWTPTFGPSTIPEWTPNHRGAGIAHACLTYEYDPNVFTGGAPAPVWTVQGSTEIYNASTLTVGYSGYPADVYYTILRGIQSPNGTRLGVGLAAADIDQAKIAAWRAVCVANNWTVGGVWQVTAETPADVLRAVLQAGGAEFAINDGKASVDFFASAASAYTIRESDLAGDPIERPSTDRKARVSRIIPRFRSEADGWDLVPAAPVVDTTLDTQDGNRRRTETIDFPYVSSAQQARQLAAYNLRARRSPVFELPIKPHGVGIPSGARVTLDLGEYGISTTTGVVIKNDATAIDGGTLTVRSDPVDLHTWALSQDGSTASGGSMPRDPASTVQNVDTVDWSAAAASITASGTTLPIIRVTGTFPNPTLARLDVQIKPNASTDWIDTNSLVSGTPALEIRGLTPNTIYNIRARYVTTGGAASPGWTNFANVTTGTLVAGEASSVPINQNLLKNPTGALNSTRYWTRSGSTTAVNAALLGDGRGWCFFGAFGAGTFSGQMFSDDIPMASNQPLTLSGIMEPFNVITNSMILSIEAFNSSGVYIGSVLSFGSGLVSGSGTTPAGTASVRVYFQPFNSVFGTSGFVVLRQIKLELGSNRTLWTDDALQAGQSNADVTNQNIAAAITGQGTGATANNLTGLNPTEGGKLTGIAVGATKNVLTNETLALRPTGTDGDFHYATDTFELFQKVSGSWVLASTNGATVGTNFRFPDGSTAPIGRVDNALNQPDGNLWRYSLMERGTRGYQAFATSGAALTGSVQLMAFSGIRLVKQDFNSTTNGSQIYLGTNAQGLANVKPGQRYSVQARIQTSGAISGSQLAIDWRNSDNTATIGFPTLVSISGISPLGTLVQAFATAPAGAAYANVFLIGTGTNAGAGFLALYEGQITPVSTIAEVHPAFTQGPFGDDGADQTGTNTAAAIIGQGSNATKNTNAGALASRPTGADGDTYHATDTKEIYFKTGGSWVKVADVGNTFSVALSTTIISATGTGTTLTTGNVTATPSGGTGPYSYAWAVVTKDVQSLNPFMISQTATSACRVTLGAGQAVFGTIQLTVTDTATGATALRTLDYNITNTA